MSTMEFYIFFVIVGLIIWFLIERDDEQNRTQQYNKANIPNPYSQKRRYQRRRKKKRKKRRRRK